MTDSTTHDNARSRVLYMTSDDANCPRCGIEFLGRAEIADRLGVSINTVDSWRSPDRRPTNPPFPPEAFRLASAGGSAGVPVWDWPTIEEWAEERARRAS